jgi:Flp pilus assembly protein TadG
MNSTRGRRRILRRGAVAVEFAIMAPVLLMIAVWMCEGARLYEVKAELATAAREGARLAAMDRRDLTGEGQTTNDKIINDIRSFLNTSGLPGDATSVYITNADNPNVTFDLDDPVNDLEFFELRVELPYSEVRPLILWEGENLTLVARLTFRNARAVMVE